MRTIVAIGVVAVTALLVPASAVPASSPPVPLFVQRAIKKQVRPLIAYVPTRLPAGWRYLRWGRPHTRHAPVGMSIEFAWRQRREPDLYWGVAVQSCPRDMAPMKTLHIHGFKVFWSTTYEDATAWICRRRNGHPLYFQATAPGYGAKEGPTALVLARFLGSTQPIR
jgi:hypothetical protein